jgi:hypothetical protein
VRLTPPLYQGLLHTIGADLDAAGAAAFSIIEVPEGFFVRDLRPTGEVLSQLILLATLEDHDAMLLGKRGSQRRGLFCRRVSKAEETTDYQDLLRALGYALQEAHAYYILIDESDAGLLVTYQTLRPEAGFVPRKTVTVLDLAA